MKRVGTMDYRGRRHERGSNWSDPEIVELLQLWSDETVQLELESSLRNQHVFDRIAAALRDRSIYRTGDQCREKIKKMKLEYRRIKDNHKLRSWKFYDVMDRVLANRPAITYSSLGGAVIAHQVLHSPSGTDLYMHGLPATTFGPATSGGFLFGNPPRPGDDALRVKCEDVESGDGAPPQLLYNYGSEDDQETERRSAGLDEDPVPLVERGECIANMISPSDFSDQNLAGSSGTGASTSAAPAHMDPEGQGERQATRTQPPERQRKRRRGAGRGAGSCGGHGALDHALVSFLKWQRSAEERLLSLEEARLEREARAEERREQQEERRAERERQHELRLLSVFAGALAAARHTGPSPADSTLPPAAAPPGSLYTHSVSTSSTNPEAPAASSALSRVPVLSPPSAETLVPAGPPPISGNILATLRGADTPGHSVYLSRRGNTIRQHQGILQEGYTQYHADKHHDTDNPGGIINMGTSENKLCYDLLHKRLAQSDMQHMDAALLQYPDWKGHRFLREEVARFLTHYCHPPSPLKADRVVVMNGCGSLFSSIAAVICDPEDAMLIPTPFYGVITEDLHLYSGVRLFHVPLDCEPSGLGGRPFQLTASHLEKALTNAKREGVNIRAVILVNPHNPLAEVYSPQEMRAFLEFAKKHKLHAIVDEVYMLTVFDDSVPFHSVLSLDSLPDPQRTHVMWGTSKDFAMAGMRVGTLYTQNQDLVEALDQMGAFHGVPGPIQHQVAQLLQDRDWVSGEFLPETRRRLQAAHSYVARQLQGLGVPYLHRSAGFYIWADLRKYLREASFAEELSLWRCFLRHKVVLSCGQAFSCSTPGWFRIVFTQQQRHLQLGMERIRQALEETEAARGSSGTGATTASGGQEEASVRSLKKEDSTDSDKAVTVNSVSVNLPENKPTDESTQEDEPAPDIPSLASEDLVLLDCQTAQPADGLDSLIGALRQQIRSSDWLEKNTPELAAGEDPGLLDVFTELLDRARK
ncbi:1-aminocyclopropane-1-carboxylate synthase-like protein 1 [Osmerus eperlanus]|uniref:1-aminocyclopropane-1-carboxylate synthase-like protein 1 n=1 Tax=Osmerus eperlanus TaxID=29151 RepID=UPI002E15E866